jgi:hypothetical protein
MWMGREDNAVSEAWIAGVPVLERFAQVADPSRYAPLPDDWRIGVSDVVGSTAAIEAGRYKAVNLAGAATISAVTNALDGDLPLFAFGGDGAHFAVPPDQAALAAEALRRVATWAERDLELGLRVGMTSVSEIRAAGLDVTVAFWKASDDVRYAMFAGEGLEWAEAQLKSDALALPASDPDGEPDLTGLSCQWGPIRHTQGKIVSLIVKKAPGTSQADFSQATAKVIGILEETASGNPVPAQGPDVRWPSRSIALQSRVAQMGRAKIWRRLSVIAGASLAWVLFKSGRPIGRFDPARYRREITVNTDFRKFDDGLMMTVDCSQATIGRLRDLLEDATKAGVIRYGLHTQEEALMTCVVPSILSSGHMHFIDGSDGGYAAAARQLRD